jgi:hypothetical protein
VICRHCGILEKASTEALLIMGGSSIVLGVVVRTLQGVYPRSIGEGTALGIRPHH